MVVFLISDCSCWAGCIALREWGRRSRGIAGSFAAMLLRVVGYVAGLFAVQRSIGFPSYLSW